MKFLTGLFLIIVFPPAFAVWVVLEVIGALKETADEAAEEEEESEDEEDEDDEDEEVEAAVQAEAARDAMERVAMAAWGDEVSGEWTADVLGRASSRADEGSPGGARILPFDRPGRE